MCITTKASLTCDTHNGAVKNGLNSFEKQVVLEDKFIVENDGSSYFAFIKILCGHSLLPKCLGTVVDNYQRHSM